MIEIFNYREHLLTMIIRMLKNKHLMFLFTNMKITSMPMSIIMETKRIF